MVTKKKPAPMRLGSDKAFVRRVVRLRLEGAGLGAIAEHFGLNGKTMYQWISEVGPGLAKELGVGYPPVRVGGPVPPGESREKVGDGVVPRPAQTVPAQASLALSLPGELEPAPFPLGAASNGPGSKSSKSDALRYAVLKAAVLSGSLEPVAKRHGVSTNTCYAWLHQYGKQVAEHLGVLYPFRPSRAERSFGGAARREPDVAPDTAESARDDRRVAMLESALKQALRERDALRVTLSIFQRESDERHD